MTNYTCIYCGILIKNLTHLNEHLKENHSKIKEDDKKEIINDFIKKNEIDIKKRDLINKKNKKIESDACKRIKKRQNEIKEIISYKDTIVPILLEYKTPPKILNKITQCNNLLKIKRLAMNCLNEKTKESIIKTGLDLNYCSKKKLKKKMKISKNYNDSTTSSIFPIYTPMGNKK